jgi:hypothetical protein
LVFTLPQLTEVMPTQGDVEGEIKSAVAEAG